MGGSAVGLLPEITFPGAVLKVRSSDSSRLAWECVGDIPGPTRPLTRTGGRVGPSALWEALQGLGTPRPFRITGIKESDLNILNRKSILNENCQAWT